MSVLRSFKYRFKCSKRASSERYEFLFWSESFHKYIQRWIYFILWLEKNSIKNFERKGHSRNIKKHSLLVIFVNWASRYFHHSWLWNNGPEKKKKSGNIKQVKESIILFPQCSATNIFGLSSMPLSDSNIDCESKERDALADITE